MKRISEEQAVNAQAKAFIKTLPDCRCEELTARVKELEAFLLDVIKSDANRYRTIKARNLLNESKTESKEEGCCGVVGMIIDGKCENCGKKLAEEV